MRASRLMVEKFPRHLSGVGLTEAVSDQFCNFPKPTIRHSHPLHTGIGQLGPGFELLALFFSVFRQIVLFSLFT